MLLEWLARGGVHHLDLRIGRAQHLVDGYQSEVNALGSQACWEAFCGTGLSSASADFERLYRNLASNSLRGGVGREARTHQQRRVGGVQPQRFHRVLLVHHPAPETHRNKLLKEKPPMRF